MNTPGQDIASPTSKPTVLFVCTHNAGRSALGAALARAHGGDQLEVQSAGVDPETEASPVTIASLAEIGIDDSSHQPTALTVARVRDADVVVAMKPGLDLPQIAGVRYETWSLPDPCEWEIEDIRPLRDEIDRRVLDLVGTMVRDGRFVSEPEQGRASTTSRR